MPCTVLRKIKRVDDRAGAPVPIESERELQVFAFTRFPNANRCPSRSKSGTGFRSKTLWLVKGFPLCVPKTSRFCYAKNPDKVFGTPSLLMDLIFPRPTPLSLSNF